MDLSKYQGTEVVCNPNYMLIPVNTINMCSEGVAEFNSILKELKQSSFNKIIRTRSGGISYKTRFPAWDMRNTSTVVELTIVEFYMYRIQIRNKDNHSPTDIRGRQAFNKFRKILKKHGIDLDSYAIENGPEIKATIEKPYIKLERESSKDLVYDNAHHIDFHNSYPAGLANTHPEFRPIIEELYSKRKVNEEYKAILNLSIGFMQSLHCCDARWAHLSRDAIADNNRRLENLAQRLKDSGRVVLLYNTDGIWYTGEIYHGEGEGPGLGQWHNDHVNATWRAKSSGAYEFIEDGKYYPVLRGRTKYDTIKPRFEWSWGDIYNTDAKVIKYFITDNGLEEEVEE